MEKEVADITKQQIDFKAPEKRVSERTMDFKNYHRPGSSYLSADDNKEVMAECKERQEADKKEEEKDTSVKYLDGEDLFKCVGDLYFAYKLSDWDKLSEDEKKETEKPYKNYQEWITDYTTKSKMLRDKINDPKKSSITKREARIDLQLLESKKYKMEKILNSEINFWREKQIITMWYVPNKIFMAKNHQQKIGKLLRWCLAILWELQVTVDKKL